MGMTSRSYRAPPTTTDPGSLPVEGGPASVGWLSLQLIPEGLSSMPWIDACSDVSVGRSTVVVSGDPSPQSTVDGVVGKGRERKHERKRDRGQSGERGPSDSGSHRSLRMFGFVTHDGSLFCGRVRRLPPLLPTFGGGGYLRRPADLPPRRSRPLFCGQALPGRQEDAIRSGRAQHDVGRRVELRRWH